MAMKHCWRCKTEHPRTAFGKNRSSRDGLEGSCRQSRRGSGRARWDALSPDERLARELRWLYGISLEEYDRLRAQQDYRCAICRLPESESDRSGGRYGKTRVPRLHVDHDHRTNEVRGLLCRWCNQMLGSAKDDPARLRGAIDYLSRFRPAQEAAELIVA